jgi:hypothetical protein
MDRGPVDHGPRDAQGRALPASGWWRNAWRVWVVFTDDADMWVTKCLKPGFRHCYVLYHDGHAWVSLDPTARWLNVSVMNHLPPGYDLPNWLRSFGLTVIPARIIRDDVPKPFPVSLFTCVEMAKRFLGIRCRKTLTPWQLHQKLAALAVAQQGGE